MQVKCRVARVLAGLSGSRWPQSWRSGGPGSTWKAKRALGTRLELTSSLGGRRARESPWIVGVDQARAAPQLRASSSHDFAQT